MGKSSGVTLRLDRLFFDNIFEPARRDLEKQMGVKVGQLEFTRFLAKKNVKFKIPKQKMNLKSNLKIKKKFKAI